MLRYSSINSRINFLISEIYSRFTYINITEAALSVKKFEWTEQFIRKYKSKLEPAFQKFLYAFTKSLVLDEQKKFSEALDYIMNINFVDQLMELDCRIERIRIFVELKNYEIAEYHIKSMQTFMQRNSNIDYQSNYYKTLPNIYIEYCNYNPMTYKKSKSFKQIFKHKKLLLKENGWLGCCIIYVLSKTLDGD